MGDSVGVSFECLADCLDVVVNKGFYLTLRLSMFPLLQVMGDTGLRSVD